MCLSISQNRRKVYVRLIVAIASDVEWSFGVLERGMKRTL